VSVCVPAVRERCSGKSEWDGMDERGMQKGTERWREAFSAFRSGVDGQDTTIRANQLGRLRRQTS
jgi:hypothetical protein